MTSKTYKSVKEEINALNIPLKTRLLTLLVCGLVSLLIVAGPIVACVNFLIFNNYAMLYAFIICLLVLLFVFLTDYLYLNVITKKGITGLYHIWAIDMIFASVVVFLVFELLHLIGVV